MLQLVDIETNGTLKDVRLDKLTVSTVLNTEDITAKDITDKEIIVLAVVKRAVTTDEIVIVTVEIGTEGWHLTALLGLLAIKGKIGITEKDILTETRNVRRVEIKGLEDGTNTAVAKDADLVTINDDDAVTVMAEHSTAEMARLHRQTLLFLSIPDSEEVKLNGGRADGRTLCLCVSLALGRGLGGNDGRKGLDGIRLVEVTTEIIFQETVKTLA